MEFTAKSEGAHRGEAAAKESKMSFRRKVTVRRSGNRSDEKQPRIDTTWTRIDSFIRIYLRSFAVRKSSQKKRITTSGVQRKAKADLVFCEHGSAFAQLWQARCDRQSYGGQAANEHESGHHNSRPLVSIRGSSPDVLGYRRLAIGY